MVQALAARRVRLGSRKRKSGVRHCMKVPMTDARHDELKTLKTTARSVTWSARKRAAVHQPSDAYAQGVQAGKGGAASASIASGTCRRP